MKASNYIYASTKIRSLEKLILDNTDIERMVDAPDLDSAFKVLHDTDYRDNLLDVEPVNYRLALSADFQQFYILLQRLNLEREFYQLMLLERDFTNIKLIFKAKLFNVDVAPHLKNNVLIPPTELKEIIFEASTHSPDLMASYPKPENRQILENKIKKIVYEVKKTIPENIRPDELDTILSQKYFDLKQELAEKINSSFISNYIKTEIDAANLLIYIRAKRLKLPKEKLIKKVITGGQADINRIVSQYSEDIRSIKPFVSANFDQKVLQVFDEFCEKNNLFEVEKALDNFKIRFARKAKMYSYGPEVIFGYYLAKQNAITNIRIILTGKSSGLPSQAIKQTLREVY